MTADPIPAPPPVAAPLMLIFAMHDSYHLGQLAYIGKALGLSSLVG